MNDKIAKVRQKQDLQYNIQIQKETEEADALTHDYNPLENITCRIGDNACAAKHVSVIQRIGLFHPMNESHKVQSLLRLQRKYGNRFVQRVIAQHVIQTKLTIGQPGDIYEKEADGVAEQVMRMSEPQIQRQPEEEEEEELIQTKSVFGQITSLVQKQVEEEEEELQAKYLSGRISEVTPNLEKRVNAIKGGGQPLPESVRAFSEPRFGYDFSKVRIYTDSQASEVARLLNARAFTLGRDIVFGTGQYSPDTTEGKRLLAHELTHVVQQHHAIPKKKDLEENQSKTSQGLRINTQVIHNVVQRGVAAGCYVRHLPSTRIGEDVHRQIQAVCTALYGTIQEFLIPGDGQADLVLQGNPVEIGEIKPNTWLRTGRHRRALGQLNRYIQGYRRWRRVRVTPMRAKPVPIMPFVHNRRQWLITYGPLEGIYYYHCRTRRVRRRRPRTTRRPAARPRRPAVRPRRPPTVRPRGLPRAVGRATWRQFWRVAARRFAIRGAAAVALSAADGPLPIGELISLGLAIWTIWDIINLWNELWAEAEQET